MHAELIITNVRPPLGEAVDLVINEGRIVAAAPGAASGVAATTVRDGGGRLLFPGFVDAHTHMDKTLLGLGWQRNEVGPAILEKITHERELRRDRQLDFQEQSAHHARLAIATGTTHIRTFVDIDTENGLGGFHGIMAMREQFREALTIQVVAFPQSGMLVRPGTVELLETALREGADLIGGLDPSAIDRNPAGHLDTIFGLAEKYNVDVDLHLHEPGELGAFAVELIAERTKVLGWQGRVTISHAFCLGGVDDAHLGRLIDLLLANDIAIMSHGPSGLGAAPSVKRLHEAGVRLCTGNDGIRDAWGPLNMPDMLLRSFIVAYRNNLRRDDEIAMVLEIATASGAQVIGATDYGLHPGCWADVVLVDGENHIEAVIERPARWLVAKRGRLLVQGGEYVGP